jgi:hypothetical protein
MKPIEITRILLGFNFSFLIFCNASSAKTLQPADGSEPRIVNVYNLGISQPIQGGGNFSIVCGETNVTFTGMDGQGQPLRWTWDAVGGARQKAAVQTVTPNAVAYHATGRDYQLRLSPDGGGCVQLSNGTIRLSPNASGKLGFILN